MGMKMARDLDVGMKCIKYMLFISNFMFVMIGFVLISMGSSIRAIYGDFEVFMERHYFSPAGLLVAIGVIIFFVSLFGCLGAIKESTLLINIYALLLGCILVLEISAAISAYTMRNGLMNSIEYNMFDVMQEYKENTETVPTEAMDFLQQRLQCCGVHSYTDWGQLPEFNTTINATFNEAPESCCIDDNCDTIFVDGCLNRLVYVISECAVLLGSGAICVAFVQFLGMIFAHLLAKAVRRIKTETEMEKQLRRQQLYMQIAQEKDEKGSNLLI